MKRDEKARAAIRRVLTEYYFPGVYAGDIDLLTQIYAPTTLVTGDIKGEPYAKTLAEYLHGVAHRVSPKDSGTPYETEIVRIEVVNSIAVATVRVRMYIFNYYDFLSFHEIDGKWLIVHKMLTHVDPETPPSQRQLTQLSGFYDPSLIHWS